MSFLTKTSTELLYAAFPNIKATCAQRSVNFLSFYLSPNSVLAYHSPSILSAPALIKYFSSNYRLIANYLLLGQGQKPPTISTRNFLNAAHIFTKGLLIGCFRNHLMDPEQANRLYVDIESMIFLDHRNIAEQIIRSELKSSFELVHQPDVPEKRSNFVIHYQCQMPSLQEFHKILLELPLLRIPNINKILIFSASTTERSMQLTLEIQDFCRTNSVRVKILQKGMINTVKYIFNNLEGGLLIHQSVNDSIEVYDILKEARVEKDDQSGKQQPVDEEFLTRKEKKQLNKQKMKATREFKPSKEQPQSFNKDQKAKTDSKKGIKAEKEKGKGEKEKVGEQEDLDLDLFHMPRELIILRQLLPQTALVTEHNEKELERKMKALLDLSLDQDLFPPWRFAYSDIAKNYANIYNVGEFEQTPLGFSVRRMVTKEWRKKNMPYVTKMQSQALAKQKTLFS